MGRMSLRWRIAGVAAALVVAVLAVLFMPRSIEVDAARVNIGPIDETVQDQGVARVREAFIVAAPVSGRLQRIDLHVGDRVSAGRTVVARILPSAPDLLDPRTRAQAEATVAAAGASVSAARLSRERLQVEALHADQIMARTRTLAEAGAASKQARETAEAEAEVAHVAVNAADAELRARQAQLAAARSALMGPGAATAEIVPVTAPATGYVTRVLQESERTVPMGTPLVEIGESRGLEAQIEFLSQDAVRIREGMPAEIYDWGGGAPIPAVVRRVEPEGYVKVSALGVEEHRVLVMLQFTGPPEQWARLAPGYGVWGRVFLRRESRAERVPLGALVGSGRGWAVFRIEGGRARLTPVSVGAMTDREAEIRGGLRAGDAVVVFPSDLVRDGVRVRARAAH